jgi:DNA-binding FrmR family transcriptional regulator
MARTVRASKPEALRTRGSYQASKQDLQRRLARVRGQVSGVAQMVEDERCCPEVLTQLAAAMAALEKIGFILLRDHVQTCVVEGVVAGDGEAYLDELIATVQRFAGR